ncbi:Helitron helicase [Phytophthora megakarya]|uniref:Helitron helicase n=1 Tax=Phytophthora megakarya TaxID=4795 RepID=A0A225W3R8_9STRA|nr:Helitron helicase [Phytophthora megakarya]
MTRGRKRKYNSVEEIEEAFRIPDHEESAADRRKRMRSRRAALNRLQQYQRENDGAVNDTEHFDEQSTTTGEAPDVVREHERARLASWRNNLSDDQRNVLRDHDTAARSVARIEMGDKQRQEIQERDATATRASRRTMTLDERLELREEERFRSRSRQYKKGYNYHEDFDPTIIRGKDTVANRHYISRFLRSGEERRCAECGAWKFPGETKKCCCIDGKVKLPPRREAPRKLRLLFNNPVFIKSMCAYNNVSAFTSIGATRSEPLRVDESVTNRGIYNFRVMGIVCHRMGSLLRTPGGKWMFAQIYINDPDSGARVANRIRMTDGLSAEFLSDLDEVMEQYHPYAQQFLHAREILIERSRPSLEAARAERRHNTPTASEVAAIIIDANGAQSRDIVLYTRQGGTLFYIPTESPGGHTSFHTRVSKIATMTATTKDEQIDQNDQNMEGELAEWGYIVQ